MRDHRSTAAPVLVTGATGNVGRDLVRQLLNAGVAVRAVVRDRERASLPAGVDAAVADLDRPETLAAAAAGARAAFVLGGRADMPGAFAALAAAGVEHAVLLTSRSVIGGVAGNAIVDMWNASEAAAHAANLGWTILRPSSFMSNALRWRPQLAVTDTVRVVFADAPVALIDPADIAAVAAAALADPGRYASQALELTGPAPLLPAEQLAILGRVLGRRLQLEPLTGDAARADLAAMFPPAFVEGAMRLFEGGEFDDARVVSTVAELTGRPPGTFAAWAAAHTADFA